MQRLFSHKLAAALILSATLLGLFTQPVFADTTGFLSLINSYRQQNNLGTLNEDQNLTNAACWMSIDLDINNFSHTDSLGRDMSTRLSDFGVSGGSRAENIYYTTAGSSATLAFTAWRNSPPHNTNMLGAAYTRIGIGRANVNGRWYWTTDFANGSATTLTNQCGTSVNQTPPPVTKPPSPQPSKVTPSPISTPTPIVVQAPPTEVVVSTSSAAAPNLAPATDSASISAKVVEIGNNHPQEPSVKSLVKGSFLAVSLLGYLILFGFIFWQLFHHFRMPPIEHEEET